MSTTVKVTSSPIATFCPGLRVKTSIAYLLEQIRPGALLLVVSSTATGARRIEPGFESRWAFHPGFPSRSWLLSDREGSFTTNHQFESLVRLPGLVGLLAWLVGLVGGTLR